MGKYILNQETQKIELHFDKAEYLALSPEQKAEIKRFFLWSRYAGAWVSRSKNDHYWPVKIAEKLGLENGGKEGERLSFEEEIQRKAERAERRADRMETHAENAEKRGDALQAELNSYRGDIAFFTQPIISGHSGSESFARRRQRIFDRYHKGFEEYKKSGYFRSRAEIARQTASMAQLENPVYLHNRIKECKATIAKLEKNITAYEERLDRIGQGEVIKGYDGKIIPTERYEVAIQETLEKMEYEIDKLAFLEGKLEEIGGNRFSKDNIKPGYIVKVRRWETVQVVTTGPANFLYKMINETGHLKDWPGQAPYAAIIEIVKAKEVKETIQNPYKAGDILCSQSISGNRVITAYQVIKTTATGVRLREIAVEDGAPVADRFISEKSMLRKVISSKFSDFIGVYMDDWRLYKWELAQKKEGL